MGILGRGRSLRTCPSLVGVAVVVFATALQPAVAEAQTTPGTIKSFLRDLFVTVPTPAEINAGLVDQIEENAARFPEEVAKLLSLGVFTVPIGSSSAGFAFSVDPRTGESIQKSESFGPLFAERALTSGKGVWNLAFNYQRTTFDRINGIEFGDQGENSQDQGLFIYDNHVFYPSPPVDQYLTERTFFSATASSFNFFVTYGVTENLDLGVVVPVVSIKSVGRRQLFWHLPNTWDDPPEPFPSPTGDRDVIARTELNEGGIGDIQVRSKFSPFQSHKNAFAVVVDLRLPTGDEENLLGTGEASVRFGGVASTEVGSGVSLHGNGGYTAGGLSDEFHYVAAADVALGARKQLTLAGSLIGQIIKDGVQFETLRTFDSTNPTSGIRTTFDRQFANTDTLHIVNAAVGAKYHLTGQWLLTGSVLFPLNDAGFRGQWTAIVGLDHTWTPPRR